LLLGQRKAPCICERLDQLFPGDYSRQVPLISSHLHVRTVAPHKDSRDLCIDRLRRLRDEFFHAFPEDWMTGDVSEVLHDLPTRDKIDPFEQVVGSIIREQCACETGCLDIRSREPKQDFLKQFIRQMFYGCHEEQDSNRNLLKFDGVRLRDRVYM